jgi:TrmH family RNA methyltransferase
MLSRAEERLINALQQRKGRAEHGRFLAEGVRVVEEALASGDLDFAVISPSVEDNARGGALAAELERRGLVRRVSEVELNKLAGTDTPQGVLVVAHTPVHELEELKARDGDKLLLLDGVQDPGNFGTLVRAADALGVRAVIALPGTVDPWNPKSVRSAAGSTFHLPVIQADVPSAAAWLGANGFTLYAGDARGAAVRDVTFAGRAALVVGNEGAGLSDAVRSLNPTTVAIPMRGRAESLNVGVAAGILLYLLTERSHG